MVEFTEPSNQPLSPALSIALDGSLRATNQHTQRQTQAAKLRDRLLPPVTWGGVRNGNQIGTVFGDTVPVTSLTNGGKGTGQPMLTAAGNGGYAVTSTPRPPKVEPDEDIPTLAIEWEVVFTNADPGFNYTTNQPTVPIITATATPDRLTLNFDLAANGGGSFRTAPFTVTSEATLSYLVSASVSKGIISGGSGFLFSGAPETFFVNMGGVNPYSGGGEVLLPAGDYQLTLSLGIESQFPFQPQLWIAGAFEITFTLTGY